ncbi:MAG TPA: divalent metal cation transporter [Chthonomonadaceae bacterium]|nr:divalent metal cation transporter [Chthonomonadaceae bacterium]
MLGRDTRQTRRRLLNPKLLLLLSLIGPGIIAANADNDASGIYGYSLAGVQYEYGMLWVLVLVTISLGVCQEMGARMGAVTGKGLADLIREEYGVKVTFFAMIVLLIANYATTVSEFAGITAAVQIFAPPHYRSLISWCVVTLVAGGIWLLVTRGNYKRVERILLYASLIYLAYIVSAFMAHPPWGEVMQQMAWPHLKGIRLDHVYIFAVINVIGTTITPWGQFYIQSTVRDKGIRADEYPYTRLDVLFGAFFTNFIAFFIIVACGKTLFQAGLDPTIAANKFNDAGQIALALRPVAGSLAAVLFAIGLFNASCFGAITVPLSTSYAITESLGSESGLGRRAREAPMFVGVFSFIIFFSALTVLALGNRPEYLAALILLPNIVGAALLPIILVLSLRLINNKRLMGDKINGPVLNVIAWATAVILIILSLILLVYNLLPGH